MNFSTVFLFCHSGQLPFKFIQPVYPTIRVKHKRNRLHLQGQPIVLLFHSTLLLFFFYYFLLFLSSLLCRFEWLDCNEEYRNARFLCSLWQVVNDKWKQLVIWFSCPSSLYIKQKNQGTSIFITGKQENYNWFRDFAETNIILSYISQICMFCISQIVDSRGVNLCTSDAFQRPARWLTSNVVAVTTSFCTTQSFSS